MVFGIAEPGHIRSVLEDVGDLRPAYFTRSDVFEWRKRVREHMERVGLRLLEMEGQEVDVLMEQVDERLDRAEAFEWNWWW